MTILRLTNMSRVMSAIVFCSNSKDGSPLFVCGTCPQSDLPVGMVYIGDSFATRFRTVLPCVMADLTFSQAQSLCRSGRKGRDSVYATDARLVQC